jgi:GTPase SAR1 family protein
MMNSLVIHCRAEYYDKTDVFMVVFSLVNRASFENVRAKWHLEVVNPIRGRFRLGTPFVLVGSKLDLRDDATTIAKLTAKGEAPISYEEGLAMATELGAAKYMEVSALTQQGVKAAFEDAIRIGLSPPSTREQEKAVKKNLQEMKVKREKEKQERLEREKQMKSNQKFGKQVEKNMLVANTSTEEYILDEKVGVGGFAEVYKAWKVQRFGSNKLVAIKRMYSYDEETLSEIAIQKSLCGNSSMIVKLHESYLDNGVLHIVMEYCEQDLQYV